MREKMICQAGFSIVQDVDGWIVPAKRLSGKASTSNKKSLGVSILKNMTVLLTVVLLGCFLKVTAAFTTTVGTTGRISPSLSMKAAALPKITTSVEDLEKDLTPSEKSVTAVVRKASPSVAFVTSVWEGMTSSRRTSTTAPPKTNNNNNLPPGQSLGSGSGFVVSPDGYICTNFHVIERAYSIQQNAHMLEQTIQDVLRNISALSFLPSLSPDFVNFTTTYLQEQLPTLPQVYVRIDSTSKYQKCRIVDVNTDLDLAVLKLEDDNSNTTSPLSFVSFGASSDLLVGQTVVAIGNPFGLDTTVTTGVVSAVNREFRVGTARTPANTPIKNAIQTDASINPGNSGGPLLNLKQQVVGINTAIITTSGSSSGIGFAVPSDQLRPNVMKIIQNDRNKNGNGRKQSGWLGVEIVRQPINANVGGERVHGNNATSVTKPPLARLQNWVTKVERNSPAGTVGIRQWRFHQDTACIEYGDAIVAVGGNAVETFEELRTELSSRVSGEQVAITLETAKGERRVVYVTLQSKPEQS
jgi:S1-C subfamily serine protease